MDDQYKPMKNTDESDDGNGQEENTYPPDIDESEFEVLNEDENDVPFTPDDVVVEETEGDEEDDEDSMPVDEDEYEVLDENLSSSAAMAAATGTAEKSFARNLLEWIECIAIAVVIALLIRSFVFTMVKVDGPSMVPTLHDGDRLFVTRLFYEPENNDIIIFTPDSSKVPFVKRVIATEGQTIDIDYETGNVMVDGKVLDEPYIADRTHLQGDMQLPATVPEDCVFAMGDNRNKSHDSRYRDVGFVRKDQIMGGVKFRVWPFSKFGPVE